MEGSSLSMKCHVVANPADVSIHWSFNGRDIDSLHPLSGIKLLIAQLGRLAEAA